MTNRIEFDVKCEKFNPDTNKDNYILAWVDWNWIEYGVYSGKSEPVVIRYEEIWNGGKCVRQYWSNGQFDFTHKSDYLAITKWAIIDEVHDDE